MPDTSMLAILADRASRTPDRDAYVWLDENLQETERLTYGDLWQRAGTAAAGLRRNLEMGARVIVPTANTPAFVLTMYGCFRAGIVPVPVAVRAPRKMEPLITRIAQDCGAGAVLEAASGNTGTTDATGKIRMLDTRGKDAHPPDDGLAFIQYTSGSVSSPKGVCITHGNILANMAMIADSFGHDETTAFVTWLPFYHDMGLVGTLLQPAYLGTTSYVMAPATFLRRPVSWLRAISTYRAHTSGGPNFSYAHCVDQITADECEGLDLSSWLVAFNGAEPIQAGILRAFAEKFTPFGFSNRAFFPCYGMAEATLFISGGPKDALPQAAVHSDDDRMRIRPVLPEPDSPDGLEVVSCGQVAAGISAIVLDGEGRMLAEGETGEIAVSGPNVTSGYVNPVHNTGDTFPMVGERRYFRTGDLGFMKDGAVFIRGRLKDLIIVQGRNIHPEDVEVTAWDAAPERLTRGRIAVFQQDDGGIALVAELRRNAMNLPQPEYVGIAEAIRESISREWQARIATIVLVRNAAIPVTTSGKVSRARCRTLLAEGGLPILLLHEAAPSAMRAEPDAGDMQGADIRGADIRGMGAGGTILATIARGLGLDPADLLWPLSRVGLDSMAALVLQHRLEMREGISVPLQAIFESTNLDALMAAATPITADPEPDPGGVAPIAPLTPTQRAIWLAQSLAPDRNDEVIFLSARFDGPVDEAQLGHGIGMLLARHPILCHAVIERDDDLFLAPGAGQGHFRVLHEENGDFADSDEMVRHLMAKPFGRRGACLFEVTLLVPRNGPPILLLGCHHVISDLWSLGLILRDLGELLDGRVRETPPPAGTGFIRHSHHLDARLHGEEGRQAASFWRETLSPLPDPPSWPQDVEADAGVAGPVQLDFEIPAELGLELDGICRELGVPAYTVLCAAYALLIHGYTGSSRMNIGSPATGRTNAGLAEEVGCFIDMMVVPFDLDPAATVRDLLTATASRIARGMDRSWYGAPLIAADQRLRGPRGDEALFSAMFTMQQLPSALPGHWTEIALGRPGVPFALGPLRLTTTAHARRPPLASLDMAVTKTGRGLRGYLGATAGRFGPTALGRMIASYVRVLERMCEDLDRPLATISMLSEKEYWMVVEEWNHPACDLPPPERLERLFERQCRMMPDATALQHDAGNLTYRQLEHEAELIAGRIRAAFEKL